MRHATNWSYPSLKRGVDLSSWILKQIFRQWEESGEIYHQFQEMGKPRLRVPEGTYDNQGGRMTASLKQSAGEHAEGQEGI